jgi:hypothetical protein
MPGSDVLLAAMAAAGPDRLDLPAPIGADASSSELIGLAGRLRNLEIEVGELKRFRESLGIAATTGLSPSRQRETRHEKND